MNAFSKQNQSNNWEDFWQGAAVNEFAHVEHVMLLVQYNGELDDVYEACYFSVNGVFVGADCSFFWFCHAQNSFKKDKWLLQM